jgi:predicted nucleic acid-binding protein
VLTLLDTNVLIHAAFTEAPHHEAAALLLARGLAKAGIYCIAPQNIVEFAAVATRPNLVTNPLSPTELQRMTTLLYASRHLKKIYPRRGTVMRAVRHGASLKFSGSAWYDIFLATTMQDYGVRSIITEDLTTFRRIGFVNARGIEEV